MFDFFFIGTAITTVGSSGIGSAGGGEVTNVRRRRKVIINQKVQGLGIEGVGGTLGHFTTLKIMVA